MFTLPPHVEPLAIAPLDEDVVLFRSLPSSACERRRLDDFASRRERRRHFPHLNIASYVLEFGASCFASAEQAASYSNSEPASVGVIDVGAARFHAAQTWLPGHWTVFEPPALLQVATTSIRVEPRPSSGAPVAYAVLFSDTAEVIDVVASREAADKIVEHAGAKHSSLALELRVIGVDSSGLGVDLTKPSAVAQLLDL